LREGIVGIRTFFFVGLLAMASGRSNFAVGLGAIICGIYIGTHSIPQLSCNGLIFHWKTELEREGWVYIGQARLVICLLTVQAA